LGEHLPLHGRRARDRALRHHQSPSSSSASALWRAKRRRRPYLPPCAIHAAVEGVQHLESEILGVRFHVWKYPRGSTFTQRAVSDPDGSVKSVGWLWVDPGRSSNERALEGSALRNSRPTIHQTGPSPTAPLASRDEGRGRHRWHRSASRMCCQRPSLRHLL
jgi:hypothetical protein